MTMYAYIIEKSAKTFEAYTWVLRGYKVHGRWECFSSSHSSHPERATTAQKYKSDWGMTEWLGGVHM